MLNVAEYSKKCSNQAMIPHELGKQPCERVNRAAKKLRIPKSVELRVNRRLDGSYGLIRDGFIFAITDERKPPSIGRLSFRLNSERF